MQLKPVVMFSLKGPLEYNIGAAVNVPGLT